MYQLYMPTVCLAIDTFGIYAKSLSVTSGTRPMKNDNAKGE